MKHASSRAPDLLHGPVFSNMTRFFLPIMLGSLLQQLYSMVDAVVLGRLVGKTALAAVGGSDLAIINLVKGDYTSFENAYIPTVEIGVNANTKQADLAKEFAAFVMSREVQDGDFYDGFPVNKESLHMQVSLDRSDYAAYTTIEGADGQEIGLDIEPIKAADADKLEALCDSLSKKTVKDAKVLEELKKSVPDYLLGRQSLDDTISKIQDGVKIYLAE